MHRAIAVLAFAGLLMTPAVQAEVIPVPRQKPNAHAQPEPVTVPIPRPNPRRLNRVAGNDPPAIGGGGSCLERLAGLDIAFDRLPAIGNGGGCGTRQPLSLTRIGEVEFTPPATVTCDLAQSLHQWITGAVQPAAQKRLKTRVTKVHVAASYVCRRRNNQSGGKLSEHAKANALDMSGFSFAKSDAVEVGGGWGVFRSLGLSKSGSFLDDIRKAACKSFTTVLGPGSDRYHGDHFHVDVLRRRNDYRICK